jgi:hypothetical protein
LKAWNVPKRSKRVQKRNMKENEQVEWMTLTRTKGKKTQGLDERKRNLVKQRELKTSKIREKEKEVMVMVGQMRKRGGEMMPRTWKTLEKAMQMMMMKRVKLRKTRVIWTPTVILKMETR